MVSINIEILNPKARKLLQSLADMKLISISETSPDSFFDTVKKIRARKATVSIEEIAKEVDAVRDKRYGK
jgi:hypothetical protein